MRKNFFALAQRLASRFRAEESFEADFDSVVQMVDAARAFRSHGCSVRAGDLALRLVVSVPRLQHVRIAATPGVVR